MPLELEDVQSHPWSHEGSPVLSVVPPGAWPNVIPVSVPHLLDLPPGALVKVMGDKGSLRPHCALGEAPLSLAPLFLFTGLCTALGLGHHSLGVMPRSLVFLCCVAQ